MDNAELRKIAERILLGQIEDVEFLTICEMTDDAFYSNTEWSALTPEQQYAVYRTVDNLVGKATVTIELPED